jgi:hypothetical protein
MPVDRYVLSVSNGTTKNHKEGYHESHKWPFFCKKTAEEVEVITRDTRSKHSFLSQRETARL